ncbi:hypothetical protein IMY05_008G0043100 [Salix suchowensis]|nr:hypothetical protein IMY05_008G0043100 [Salix suchowensis]
MNNDKHLCLSHVSKFLHSGDCYPASHFSSSSSLSKLPSFTFWGLSLRPYFEVALDNFLNTQFYYSGR